MKTNDHDEFVLLIQALASTFRHEPTEAMFEGYRMGLDDLEITAIKRAAWKAMRSCRFMPTVVELRELAGVVSPQHRAVLAWEAFRKAVTTVGIYRSPDFDDAAINATVRNLGGWERFLDRMETEGDKWCRIDFERVYQVVADTSPESERGAPLLGICDRQNMFNGYREAVGPPVKVCTGLPGLPALTRGTVHELAGKDRRLT